jgi:hypothetical protein
VYGMWLPTSGGTAHGRRHAARGGPVSAVRRLVVCARLHALRPAATVPVDMIITPRGAAPTTPLFPRLDGCDIASSDAPTPVRSAGAARFAMRLTYAREIWRAGIPGRDHPGEERRAVTEVYR